MSAPRPRARRACRFPLIALAALLSATLSAPPCPASPPGAGAGQKRSKALVRRTPALEAMISSGRVELVDTYGGGTVLVRALQVDLSGLGVRRRIQDTIVLRSRTIDTTPGLTLAAPPAALAAPGGHLEIVQFHGPTKAAWLEDLRAAGSTIPITYLPHNAWVVWVDDPAALGAARLPLQWREPLATGDRLSPDLGTTLQPVDVTVQVARAGRRDAALDGIRARALAVLMEARDVGRLSSIRVTLPPGAIDEIVRIPEVVWIEPFEPIALHDERSDLIAAGQVARSEVLGPGYLEWLRLHGLDDLSGWIADVTDTGIDTGGTAIVHPGLRGRIVYAEDFTLEGLREDCVGHGTNIAGIIAGGAGPGSDLMDNEGYLPGLGMVPTSRVGSTRIFDCAGQFAPAVPFTDLVASAYHRGARFGNNSWGGTGAQYNSIDAEYDALVRDADGDPANGEQQYLPVFSTGNLGPGDLTIGWPATAKNVLSVGATENDRPVGQDGCGTPNLFADNVDHVLLFSSRGPTADGRLKPDLVAPGSHIQSLASTAVDYTGIGVCDPYFPAGQRLLNWSTGTSQAAAHVTGGAIIAAEIYRRTYGAQASPAMIKAMMLNHAHDMGTTTATPSNTSNRPNNLQGWGRLDVASLVEERARFALDQRRLLTFAGQQETFEPLVVEDASRSVIATLVWTDAPGSPMGWSFVNDLDLVVEADGATYLGNVLDRGVSVNGGQADERNNVEMVVLPPGVRTLKVSVFAANLPGDGVPSVPGETDQDFALYVSNARLSDDDGLIEFTSPAAVCGLPVTLRISDTRLRGLSSATATLESGPDRETVRLSEEPPGSGLFSGAVDVDGAGPAAGDGVLQTADGQPVRAVYVRPAPGTGAAQTRQAEIPARCAPPAVTDARVTLVGTSEATIAWTTDRPADSAVAYGPGAARTLVASDPKPMTEHRVRLRGLPACTFHTATVASTDLSGLTGRGPAAPLGFSTGRGAPGRRIIFRDDMETLGSRWTHAAMSAGAADDWELGHAVLPQSGAFAGTRVWGTALHGNYSVGADAVLVSPPIDLRDVLGPKLAFTHFYAIYAGRPPTSFDDGGWVEITTDGGQTWIPIDPNGGYPETIDERNPYVPPESGVYAGTLPSAARANFDLSAYSGHLVQVRFHLWQDAAATTPTALGWYIDDVEVTAEGVCHEAALTLDADAYGCSSRVTVLLSDSDLNLHPTAIDTARVTASSASGSIDLDLTETGPATGQFQAALHLAPQPAAGRLQVAEGSAITLTYADADSGPGTPVTVQASAMIVDCAAPPAPTGVSAAPNGAGALMVTWTPVDPAVAPDLQGYRVYYDTDGSGPVYSGDKALQGPSPVRVESAPTALALMSLDACAPHYVTVTAFDRFGNESAFGPESLAVPDGPTACAAGRLFVSPSSPGCSQSLTLTLYDANADPNPLAAGQVTVEATGPSQAGSVVSTLTETAPASGLFLGTLALSATPLPGALAVADGDPVTLTYLDADDGRAQQRVVTAGATVSDCAPPAISDIVAVSRATDRAVIRWSTDEPATSVVRFGLDASLQWEASTPGLTTSHAVPIAGLSECSTVYYAVASADAKGNVATMGGGATPLHFGTYREVLVFRDDLETGAPGWTHEGFPAGNDAWELGAPVAGIPGGPPSAFSGASVWGTKLDGFYRDGADMALTSPPIDLSSARAATLTFRHWFDIYSSGPPNGFDDGAFLEVSADGGTSWTYIVPVGQYPDRMPTTRWLPVGAGAYAGSTNGWAQASFALDAYAGKVIRVRFHLVEDPGEISPEPHAGWYIDDVTLTRAVACHDAGLELDRSAYACNNAAVSVNLFDNDLDADPNAPDTALVRFTSLAETSGEMLLLTESGDSTGLFGASLPLSSLDAPGVLAVEHDDTIVASYQDADDGSGAPRTVVASARVPDCLPPDISGFRLADLAADSFRVEWTTSEAGDSRVLYGPTPALGQEVILPGSRTAHSVTVGGLTSCTPYYFTPASADSTGNLMREDSQGPQRRLETTATAALLSEDFESTAPGWSHAGAGDTWQLAELAGAGVAATAPGGSYQRPHESVNADFVLVSPPVDLSRAVHPSLTLVHRYDFPASFQGGDGGWVEAWDGSRWIALTPQGGYPGRIDPEAGRTGEVLAGYSGQSNGMVIGRFDLADLAARLASNAPGAPAVTQVRFRVFVEGGLGSTGAGWTLDTVEIGGDLDCHRGRIVFDRASLTCADASVRLALHDRDLDLSPSAIDTADVTVASSGGPAPLLIALAETTPSSGLFRGEAPLSPDGIAGTLRVAPGDDIAATYQDADDGSGSPAIAMALLEARDCAPPVITRPSIAAMGDGFLVRWVTDRPATSEALLTPASGPSLLASDHRLVTSHRLFLRHAAPCESYTASLASQDSDGLRAVAGGPGGGLVAEAARGRILFFDDMEGADPGWTRSGTVEEWQRGTPQVGPPQAFSGQRVYGTDLTGDYNGGTNAALISPPIDLTGVTSARLTFWHWYDIFANSPPNSTDDAAWVEVLAPGAQTPTYIEPIGGYPDTTDEENGQPLHEGVSVYAGQSVDWEEARFDLSPFAGGIIRLHFRIWNDAIELLINGRTGAGWYLDDVDVSSPQYCFAAPGFGSNAPATVMQGGALTGAALTGSGFRPGAALFLGAGIAVTRLDVVSSTQISFDLSVDPHASIGARDAVIVNPDGQTATLPSALSVLFNRARADADGSGRVDGNDLALLAGAFSSAEGDPRYAVAVDLNDDGLIDGMDLALLAAVFGTTF